VTIERIKFLGTLSDLPYNTKGNIPAVQGMFPTSLGGFHSGPNTDVANICSYPAYPTGAATLRDQNRNYKTYVGTATKLYEDVSPGPTDLTRAVGGAYASTPARPWIFTQFGSISLASNKVDAIQFRTLNSATAFANLAGAPKAAIIVTVGPPASPVVMCFNYNDGTDVPDGWYSSGLSDYTGWTVGTNECAKGQILDNPGPFVAAIPYRDGVIAFKEDGMWEGTYVGSPVVWAWRRIASQVGCIGPNALCMVDDTIFFASKTGLYKYDGSYPQKIPGRLHDWWAGNVADSFWPDKWNDNFNHAHFAKYIPQAGVICFGLANDSVDSLTTPDMVNLVVWVNLQSGLWALDDKWSEGTYKISNFVDNEKVLLHTASSTWKSYGINFGYASDISYTPKSQFSVSGIGSGEPGMSMVRGAKPIFEYSLAKTGNPIGQVLADATTEEYFPTTSSFVAAEPQVNNGGADFADQQISGNFHAFAIFWTVTAGNYFTVNVNGLLADTVPVGADHG